MHEQGGRNHSLAVSREKSQLEFTFFEKTLVIDWKRSLPFISSQLNARIAHNRSEVTWRQNLASRFPPRCLHIP